MTKHFLRDLEELEDQALRLAERVEGALGAALDSILSRDPVTAREVVDGDREIDILEVELEEEALKILALHAPVATDLRYLVAVIKINNDLERIGDIAANIAARAVDLEDLGPVEAPERFDLMAQCTRTMVRDAIRSLVHRDSQLARKVLAEDDTVDELQTEILGKLEDIMRARPETVEALMRWGSVVRNVERIADNATNIAEDVIYMEEGIIVRHRQPDVGAHKSDA